MKKVFFALMFTSFAALNAHAVTESTEILCNPEISQSNEIKLRSGTELYSSATGKYAQLIWQSSNAAAHKLSAPLEPGVIAVYFKEFYTRTKDVECWKKERQLLLDSGLVKTCADYSCNIIEYIR